MKVIITIIYILIIGQVGFYFGLSLPREFFDENKLPYRRFKWEENGEFYKKLKIKNWKSKAIDMSVITKRIFPKKVYEDMNSQDVDRLVKESCIAEMIHYVLCIFSVGIYNIWRGKLGAALAALYVVGNMPYVMIQRYNRPKFIALRDKMRKREERRANANG